MAQRIPRYEFETVHGLYLGPVGSIVDFAAVKRKREATVARRLVCAAYQYRFAELVSLTTPTGVSVPKDVSISLQGEYRRISVKLLDIDCFSPTKPISAQPNPQLESFIRGIPIERLTELVQISNPLLVEGAKRERYSVISAPILLAMLRHRAPHSSLKLRVSEGQISRSQLSLQKTAALILDTIGPVVIGHKSFVHRFCKTAKEGSILMNCSESTAENIRRKDGVIKI